MSDRAARPWSDPADWNWHGAVAIILAFGVMASVIILSLGAVLEDRLLSPEGAALLSTALGASVGAAATYLGSRMGGSDTAQPPKAPPP
jgi:hypothetical protein